jgi:ferredoxin
MDLVKVYAIYFSPTGGTGKAVVATAMGTGLPGTKVDLTPWQSRVHYHRTFQPNELVVVGLPVYNGRLPGQIDDFWACLQGNNTPAIAIIVYGNRAYDDALIELKMKLEEKGFKVIAAAVFIGEHTFSQNIAGGRPDAEDLKLARQFGKQSVQNIDKAYNGTLRVNGNYPYQAQIFDPIELTGEFTGWAQVGTTADCSLCGQCEDNCPWHAITIGEYVITNYAKCMRCFRCMKFCPAKAKKVIDPHWPRFVEGFEEQMAGRDCKPEFFLGE